MSPDEDLELLESTDAMLWATRWCETARALVAANRNLIDEGWMVGWFANAIEAARRGDPTEKVAMADPDAPEYPPPPVGLGDRVEILLITGWRVQGELIAVYASEGVTDGLLHVLLDGHEFPTNVYERHIVTLEKIR